MNLKKIVLATALLGGLLSTASYATTVAAHEKIVLSTNLVAPAPVKIVHPIDLPSNFKGATATLSFTVDTSGRPHDVKVMSPSDRVVAKSLMSAVSQWKFTPGLLNGVPVPTKVTLPLEVTEA